MSLGRIKQQLENKPNHSFSLQSERIGRFISNYESQLLTQHTIAFDLISIASVLLLSIIFLDKSIVNTLMLLAWSGWVITLSIVRIYLYLNFQKVIQQNNTDKKDISKNLQYLFISTFVAGISWGLAGLYLQSNNILVDHPEFLIIIAGLSVCAAAVFSSHFFSFLSFSIPVLVPFGLMALYQDSSFSITIALIDLLFILFLLFSAKKINEMISDSLYLQKKNQNLIEFLNKSKIDAEALNSKLSNEIYQRKQAKISLQKSYKKLEEMVDERTQELSQAYKILQQSQERLNLAMDASNTGLWDWNLVTDELYNSKFKELLGYEPNEIPKFIGHLSPHVHPDDYNRVKRAMVKHFKGKSDYYLVQYRIKHKDGHWIWVEDRGRAIEWDDEGKVSRMIGTRRDITESRGADEQLKLAASVFEHVSEAIFVLNDKFEFVTVNNFFTKITGYRYEDVIGKGIHEAQNLPAETNNKYREILRALRRDKFWQGELNETRKNGQVYPQWLQINAIEDRLSKETTYFGIFSDLTTRRQSEEKLKYLANYDSVTGLGNRSLFSDRLHNAINRARKRNSKLALLYMDLDRFKSINDSYGHQIGDQILKTAAKRLTSAIPDADALCRIGSDEFTAILEGNLQRSEIEDRCHNFIEAMKDPFVVDGEDLTLGCSIGVAEFPEGAKELQILINQADSAMYQSKRLGGNQFRFYSKELQAHTIEKLKLETQLRKAILEDELEVYYQPKLTLSTGKIQSVEALVRWNHPTRGLLTPDQFIPLAEETGLISAVGEVVLNKACQQAKKWQNQDLGNISVSVNLSAQQVHKGDLIELITRTVQQHDLTPSLLELELTESLLMEDKKNTIFTLDTVRNLGVMISLDDFGTGYSSLSYLKKFPIDILKIDKSFVQEIHENSDDAAITKAIIAMAHSLDIGVIAEGVETNEHLSFLKSQGCDCIQGYLISKPVNSKTIDQMLRKQAQKSSSLEAAI